MNYVFINQAIQNGINNYIKFQNNEELDKIHIFEYWVIKVLIAIYGEINIMNPYKLKKIESFNKNLQSFNINVEEITFLINYMNEYNLWLNSPILVPKTDIPNKIQKILINMILKKSDFKKIENQEFDLYNSFFDPIDKELVKLQTLIIADKFEIPQLWRRKQYQLESGLNLDIIEPELLPASDYKRFGLNINEVKQLSNLKIQEINAKIKSEDAENDTGGSGKIDPKKLILTSGSGFVDTIVLLSIMATEIMIGLIIAFSFLR